MFGLSLKSWRISVALVPAAALIAACGSTGGGTSGTPSASVPTATADTAASALVPSAVSSKGTITVAADATYAPDEFIGSDGTTVEGMDADLAKAIGAILNLKVDVVNATFATIIPGLTSGKYDLGMSSFTDSKEREMTLDFVTYFTSGTAFLVKSPGGPNIQTLDDLCGHNVGVESGTTQQDDSQAQDGKCKTAGKPGVTVQVFQDQNSTNLALSSGRVDVVMLDSQVATYQAKLNSDFKLSGNVYGVAPYGIAIPKGTGMASAVLAAVKDLISNGVYTAILKKWGIQSGAVTNPVINGATS